MKKISWVSTKNINNEIINNKINECILTKHFTNNGNNVINLQKQIKISFNINNDKEVLMVCNGAMGINALIGGLNIHYNKNLRWVVQSFTFPCSNQGLLNDSFVIDIDENMGPDINELEKQKELYDGVLITNCFGCSVNIKLYEEFCKKNNKLLLFDNAAASMTYYNNTNHLNHGIGSMVSLHHTKPIGFGEGGFIVFNKEYLEAMSRSICFGFTNINKYEYNKYASNYKMSEIAAIYISDYIKNLDNIYNHHTQLISYFIKKMNENNLSNKIKLFTNYSSYDKSLMATIPIIFNLEIDINYFINNNIEAKKYYYPLNLNCINSLNIFKNIICLPLNLDIDYNTIDYYISIIIKYIDSNL